MLVDFITLALDQLVNAAAKAHFMSGGQLTVPLVLRTQGGAGHRSAAQHSQSLESWLTHVPGLKVVMPSRAVDAAGLLASAIADPNPVVFVECKSLYFRREDVSERIEPVPIGEAVTLRRGHDVTIVALSRLVHEALAAAERLSAEDGIEAEVIDPHLSRSTSPRSSPRSGAPASTSSRGPSSTELDPNHGACRRPRSMTSARRWIAGAPFRPCHRAPFEDPYVPGPTPSSPPCEG